MVIGPEVAVAGTVNVSVFGEMVLKLVTVPLPMVTVGFGDFSFMPAPFTVTVVPGVPDPGEKL